MAKTIWFAGVAAAALGFSVAANADVKAGVDAWTDGNFANATSRNYGCATNSNYAAMVANPEDLVRGQSSRGGSSVNGSNRAIEAYRSGGSPSASSAPATGSGSPD